MRQQFEPWIEEKPVIKGRLNSMFEGEITSKTKKRIKLTTKQRHILLGAIVFLVYIGLRIWTDINLMQDVAPVIGTLIGGLATEWFRIRLTEEQQKLLGKRAGQAIVGAESLGYNLAKGKKKNQPASEDKRVMAVDRLLEMSPMLRRKKAEMLVDVHFPEYKEQAEKIWGKK